MMKRFWLCLVALACFCTPAWSTTVNIPGFEQQTFTNATGAWVVQDIVANPDGSEAVGVVYLVAPLGTGEFSAKSNYVAILTANQGWFFIPPAKGMQVYDQSTNNALIYNGTAWVDYAASGGAGTSILNVNDDLLNTTWTGTDYVQFCGFYACKDNGGGLFHREACTVDNYSCFPDKSGATFARLNVNGDVAQAGMTPGSDYDCSPITDGGKGVTDCQGAARLLQHMIAYSIAHPNTTPVIYQNQLSLKISSDGLGGGDGTNFLIDGDVCIDGGVDGYTLGSDIISDPGVIWTEGTTTIQLHDGGCIKNGAVAISHFAETWPDGAATIGEKYAVRDYMISSAQTGVSCTGGGCTVSNEMVAGYDTGVDVRGPGIQLDHLHIDGDVFLYAHDMGDAVSVDGLTFTGVLTRGEEVNNYFSIDNVTCNAGLTRVKVRPITDGPPVTNIADGMEVWINGLTAGTGAANAWDSWNVTKIASDTFDLQGSQCSGSNLDGPTLNTVAVASGSEMMTGATDQTNIREDMLVTGSGCLQSGTVVDSLWPAKNIIFLSKPTTCGISSSTGILFSGGPLVTPTNDCPGGDANSGSSGPCFVLAGAVRQISGNSPGGIATGNIGTGIQCGAPAGGGDDPTAYKVADLRVSNVHMYGVATPYHLTNCKHFTVTNFSSDNTRKLKDNLTGCALIDGNTNSAIFTNGTCGKASGYGFTLNSPDVDDLHKGAVTLSGIGGDIEVDAGQLIAQGRGAGHILVANAVRGVQLCGEFGDSDVHYEGPAAAALTDTSCGNVGSGASWWGGHLEPGGPVPTLGVDAGTGAVLGDGSNDTTGRITVGTGASTITLTFANQWVNNPNCWLVDGTDPTVFTSVISTSQTAVTFGPDFSDRSGDIMRYICVGRSD